MNTSNNPDKALSDGIRIAVEELNKLLEFAASINITVDLHNNPGASNIITIDKITKTVLL